MFLANIMPDIAVTLLSLDEGLVCVKDSHLGWVKPLKSRG